MNISKFHVPNLVKWQFGLPKGLLDQLAEILTGKMTNLAGKMAAKMAAQNGEMGAKSAGIPHGASLAGLLAGKRAIELSSAHGTLN